MSYSYLFTFLPDGLTMTYEMTLNCVDSYPRQIFGFSASFCRISSIRIRDD